MQCRNVLCQVAEELALIAGHWSTISRNPYIYPYIYIYACIYLQYKPRSSICLSRKESKPLCSLEAERKREPHLLTFSLESKVQRIGSKSSIPALFSKTTWEVLPQGKGAGCEA